MAAHASDNNIIVKSQIIENLLSTIYRVWCASGANLLYQDLERRQIEKTHQQRMGR